jgi:hypothetical protein
LVFDQLTANFDVYDIDVLLLASRHKLTIFNIDDFGELRVYTGVFWSVRDF